jgi:hypothetical protein
LWCGNGKREWRKTVADVFRAVQSPEETFDGRRLTSEIVVAIAKFNIIIPESGVFLAEADKENLYHRMNKHNYNYIN